LTSQGSLVIRQSTPAPSVANPYAEIDAWFAGLLTAPMKRSKQECQIFVDEEYLVTYTLFYYL